MQSKNQRVQMAFVCNQEWDMMTTTMRGRHCDLCNKEVLDFTRKSLADVHAVSESMELCGKFLPEQVNHTLIKPIVVPKSFKVAAVFSAFMLMIGLEKGIGQTQEPAKTEQIENKSDATRPVKEPVCDSTVVKKATGLEDKKPFLTTSRKRYYWTKRFPFVTSVRRHVMGRLVRFL